MSTEAGLTLPQNTDAERTILGAIMLDGSALAAAQEHVVGADFYRDGHRRIFDAMVALSEQGQPIDLVTLKNKLAAQHTLESAGGAAYLSELLDGLPRITNVEHWAKIIRDKSTLRQLILTAARIQSNAREYDGDAIDAVGTALTEVMRVADKANGTGGFVSPSASVKAALALIDKVSSSKDGIYGLTSSLRALDDQTAGLHPAELIVVGARPAMGKTAFAVTVGNHLAQQGRKVAFFSLEMNHEEITMRRAQSRSGISVRDLKFQSERVRQVSYGKLCRAAADLAQEPFFIDDTPDMTVQQIRGRSRRLKAEKGLDIIIVDYLQLVTGERSKGNREQEVSGISRALKQLAKELDVPVIALCQLSRACEAREDKRPQLSDLRESGGIEQDSDVVMFLYRDCVYNSTADKTKAEILVRKQRNGPNFTAHVSYSAETTTFLNDIPPV